MMHHKLLKVGALCLSTLAVTLLSACGKDYKKLNTKSAVFTPDENWSLVFEDDFDTLDWTKWKPTQLQNGIRRTAYYTTDDDILFAKDGCLTIRTKWKDGEYGEGFYTSWLESSVETHPEAAGEGYQGFAATYGYFEIRCKFPPAKGIWSAFWLMPDNGPAFTAQDVQDTGEDGAEIDIFESPFYYSSLPNMTQSAIHCDGYDERLKSAASDKYLISDPYNEFHTYGLEWNEKEYIFYVDGHKTWKTNHLNGTAKVKEYMILSVEAGGENDGEKPTNYDFWCGRADENDKAANYDFVIDYVRVYQKKQ